MQKLPGQCYSRVIDSMAKARPCHRLDRDAHSFEHGLRSGHRLERHDIVRLSMHEKNRRFAGNLALQRHAPWQGAGKGNNPRYLLLPVQSRVKRGRGALRESGERQLGLVEPAAGQQPSGA